jgi:predicted ATPase
MSSEPRARFTRVVISNYRSIGTDVSIALEDFTALVGTNGAGKSNVADVFRFLADALNDGLENAVEKRHGFDAVRRVVDGKRSNVRLRFEVAAPTWRGVYEFALAPKGRNEFVVASESMQMHLADGSRTYRFETRKGEVKQALEGLDRPAMDPNNLTLPKFGGDERLAPFYSALRSAEVYSIFPDTLREPQKPSQRQYLTKLGDNWSSILRRVMNDDTGLQLRTALARVTGDVTNARVRRAGGGYLMVEFAHSAFGDKPRWFDAANESDGTLRVSGLITALLQDPSLTLTAVEEPELTVHTGMIPLLFDYLMEAADATQVLVTTHSPDLLDLVPIESVRVVQRVGGVTTVSPVEEHQRRLVKENLTTVGELLRTEGLLGSPTSVEEPQ